MSVKIVKFFCDCTNLQTLQMYLKQNVLICLHLAFLGFFPVCNVFFSLINEWRFFTVGIGRDILINILEDCIIFLIWLTLILSKNKCFQSGFLLKMPFSSPSMNIFGLDMQK